MKLDWVVAGAVAESLATGSKRGSTEDSEAFTRPLFRVWTSLKSRLIPPGGDLFSHPVTKAVSLALQRFTTVFGMGTGGSAALEPPGSKSKKSMHYFSQPGNSIYIP